MSDESVTSSTPDSLRKLADEGLLLVLSQIGLGLAGFGGLISAFRPSGQPWSLREVGALSLLLEHSIGLMLLAILPLVVRYFVKTERRSWQISSAILFLLIIVEILTQVWRVFEYTRSGSPPGHPLLFIMVFLLVTGSVAGFAATNIRAGRSSRFISCLYWILISGTLQFWFLIRAAFKL
jgi:FtsH-binding integral membrane protein